MSDRGIRVTVLDHATGKTETTELPVGEYMLLTTEPCHVAHTQVFAKGTHILTIKGRIRR